MTADTRAPLHELRRVVHGSPTVEATVSSRGAALGRLVVDGVDVLAPTVTADPPHGMAGVVLVPWPNRVEGARWNADGVEHALEVTEPEFGHANHGLLADTLYEVFEREEERVVLAVELRDRAGYPFVLETRVEYLLEERGLRVRHDIGNVGAGRAPVAIGAHPYLRYGDRPAEEFTVEIRADHALALDSTHIPRGEFDVTGTPWDLRAGRTVADAVEHATFTGFSLSAGRVVHRLRSPDGPTVEVWADPVFAWAQLYVASDFAADDGCRTAVALEPMTAPPNAFRTGEGLRWLEPGERWTAEWGIRVVD